MRVWIFCLALLCAACGTRSQSDFQEEGQRLAKVLSQELHRIQRHEELVAAVPKLTKLFDELAAVMISARQHHQQHPWDEIPELTREGEQVNIRLQIEMERICHLEGGRTIIEKCQENALNRVDAFEKQLVKKRW